MMPNSARGSELIEHYDSVYLKRDFFGQENRLYRALIRSIVAKARIGPNARVLDAGCGQGYLSRYLAEMNLRVWCSDISSVGLKSLERYGFVFNGRRIVADVMRPPFTNAFDLVFQRSCSLFNTPDLQPRSEVVERLIDCAKPNGVVCVVYNSNMGGGGTGWFNHTVAGFRAAFDSPRLSEIEAYAVNKIDCMTVQGHSFNPFVTKFNVTLAKLTRKSCEIVIFGRRRK